MPYKKTYINHYLSIQLFTNSRRILTLVSNFLDFNISRKKTSNSMKIIFHINEAVASNRRKKMGLLYKTCLNKDGRFSCSMGDTMVRMEVKPDKNLIEATVFEFKDAFKEYILDVILMKPLQYLLARQGLFFLHASLVYKEENCVLIVGEQNAGKSTIALTLSNSGFDILSDDKCFLRILRNEVKVFPFSSKMGLHETALKNHPYLAKQVLKDYFYGDKRRISLRSISSNYSDLADLKCRMILFPCYDTQQKVGITKISAAKALDMLTKSNARLYSCYASKKIALGNFWTLHNLVKKTDAFKLTYHDKGLNSVSELVKRNLYK